jgi:predicted RNase H-like HicB family nuclease
MERVIRVHVEKLPEGMFLASSDDVQGLVAQGRTITETLEIARDVARRLLDAQLERQQVSEPQTPMESLDLTLVVGG